MTLIALTLLCVLPSPDVVEDRVLTIERNHHHCESAALLFTQLIFRDEGCIVAWRIDKGQMTYMNGGRTVVWYDGEKLRRVDAGTFYETWTQDPITSDPEVLEREWFPIEWRRGLRGERK